MSISNLNALSAAMNAEQDVAVRALKAQLAEQQLALERARMSAEDARSAMVSPDGKTDWREFCHGVCRARSRERMHSIDPAIDHLQEARHELLMALSDPGRDNIAAMTAAHTAMLKAESRLQATRMREDLMSVGRP